MAAGERLISSDQDIDQMNDEVSECQRKPSMLFTYSKTMNMSNILHNINCAEISDLEYDEDNDASQ